MTSRISEIAPGVRAFRAAAFLICSVCLGLPAGAAVQQEQKPGQPKQQRAAASARVLQFSQRWFRLTRAERRGYATKLADRLEASAARPDESPFVRAMWSSLSLAERRRLRRLRRSQRTARLTNLIQRYAGRVRLLSRIPGDLDKMFDAGKIDERARRTVLAIEDDRQRAKAFLRLRENLLLGDMLAAGRIDEKVHRRVSALPAGRERSRALATIRTRVVLSVNQHLLHVFLNPKERESLANARRLHKALERLEKKHRMRFLRITPSTKSTDLSHCLRLTRDEERAFMQTKGVARDGLLQRVYHRQREAFVDRLSARTGRARFRFLLRRVRAAKDPQAFYRLALRHR